MSLADATSAMVPTYARANVAFERGEGCWLISTTGERYLDFGAGIAVTSVGHAHPHLVEALTNQGSKLWHVSNLYQNPEGERFARRLADATFADLVFFANSGAEANEAAIKMARRRQSVDGHPERYRTLTFEGAFHGRTLAMIAAGGQAKYLDGFGPKVDGFDQIPLTDLKAVEAAIGPETGSIMIEPIQGEGGVRVVPPAFLRGLREICDRRDLVLDLRRSADRRRPHRAVLRLRALRHPSRYSHLRQGHRRGLSDVGVPRDRGRRAGADRPASTARRSAAIRWRWRSATPRSTSFSRRASSSGSRGSAWTCASGWRSSRIATTT